MSSVSIRLFGLLAASGIALCAAAQDVGQKKVSVSGSIQSDIIIPEKDNEINAKGYDEWALTNTYADVTLTSEHIDAGARFEFVKHPLPTFYDEDGFKGWGVPNIWVKARFKSWDLTLGNFYEQFGSGFILRTYEERTLGIGTEKESENYIIDYGQRNTGQKEFQHQHGESPAFPAIPADTEIITVENVFLLPHMQDAGRF